MRFLLSVEFLHNVLQGNPLEAFLQVLPDLCVGGFQNPVNILAYQAEGRGGRVDSEQFVQKVRLHSPVDPVQGDLL